MRRAVMIKGLMRRLGATRALALVGLINQYPDVCEDFKQGWFVPKHKLLQRHLGVTEPAYWEILNQIHGIGLIAKGKNEKDGKVYRIEFEAISTYLRGWRWQAAVADIALAFRHAFWKRETLPKASPAGG